MFFFVTSWYRYIEDCVKTVIGNVLMVCGSVIACVIGDGGRTGVGGGGVARGSHFGGNKKYFLSPKIRTPSPGPTQVGIQLVAMLSGRGMALTN